MEQFKKEKSIVDGMIDWVRAIDKNNTVFYANKKMREDLGDDIVGGKCYEIFCRSKRCIDCIAKRTSNDGEVIKKETVYNGLTYMVISSPILSEEGEIIGSVEVFRDITNEKILSKSLKEKNKKMRDDIAFARNMQKRMLPSKGIYNGINIDYLYEPSEFLSGDFFDLFKLSDDLTGMYMCDVVGHGVSASLLTMFVRQSLRNISKNNTKVDIILKELHKTFLALNLESDKYFSIFLAVYNNKTGELKYANAGHNSIPILIRNSEIILLEAKGYPICNIFDSVDYDVDFVEVNEGDRLFLYTDGIIETKNDNLEEFGIDKLIEIIKRENNILNNIKTSLKKFSHIQKDDYAILMAEFI